ncbi:FAD-binding domain [Microbacterium sp. KUDC0406]|uniref:FAD-binding domain n=1 Tax=Microbacterium sp. KUDC0406 TaxID=2909588 RepID=UPI001F355483|nr:FAD-binding domain [Microbacterium sp. KUDC0406]UJP10159.1 FAD-binding domain [Microbacterium sp. KUDC0406]
MRILIVGAGIAGPTLAYWLARTGHEPTIVERAPQLREGGYVVDFWGTGYDVAERMGIVPRLLDEGYRFRELREVDSRGRRVSHLDPLRLIDAAHGRYVSIARSDLARAIYDAVPGGVETIFDDTVTQLHDDGHRVQVEFLHAPPREFDLVIGADGLHSRVRTLSFDPEQQVERYLGITVAAFDIPGYRPRDELVAVTHTEVGAQALRIALRDDSTMVCFMFRHEGDLPLDDVEAQQTLLRGRLGGMGWEVPEILDRMQAAGTFYMDRASQIRLPTWSHGRIALVGDAAACPSLLAGQGSALAMVEAYVLAMALQDAQGDHAAAFAAWEQRLAAVVRGKQDAAIGLGAAFAPRNRMQLWLRNGVLGLMGIPFIANLAMGRSLRDPIDLPPVPAT